MTAKRIFLGLLAPVAALAQGEEDGAPPPPPAPPAPAPYPPAAGPPPYLRPSASATVSTGVVGAPGSSW